MVKLLCSYCKATPRSPDALPKDINRKLPKLQGSEQARFSAFAHAVPSAWCVLLSPALFCLADKQLILQTQLRCPLRCAVVPSSSHTTSFIFFYGT